MLIVQHKNTFFSKIGIVSEISNRGDRQTEDIFLALDWGLGKLNQSIYRQAKRQIVFHFAKDPS